MNNPIENPSSEKLKETLPSSEVEARQKEAVKLWSVIEMLRAQFAKQNNEVLLERGLKLLEKAIKDNLSVSVRRMSSGGVPQIVIGKREVWQDQEGNIHHLGESTEE
jgi:hypothetical protein